MGSSDIEAPLVERLRAHMFAGNDRHLFCHVGFFMTWFAAAEMSITYLLAIATRSIDVPSFYTLVRGMDARVKCERLRTASKSYKPLGPNLAERLKFFENTLIGTRNKMVHSFITVPEPFDKMYFGTVSKVGEEAPHAATLAVFRQGLWLNLFASELNEVVKTEAPLAILEIDRPRSQTPKEFLERPDP